MDEARLRIHLGAALKSRDIRRGVAALERMRSALELLDDLPLPVLQILKDYANARAKDPPFTAEGWKDFAKGYCAIIDTQIEETKRRHRRLFHGITGEPWEKMKP